LIKDAIPTDVPAEHYAFISLFQPAQGAAIVISACLGVEVSLHAG